MGAIDESQRYACAACGHRGAQPGACSACNDAPLLDLSEADVRDALREEESARVRRYEHRLLVAAIPVSMALVAGAGLLVPVFGLVLSSFVFLPGIVLSALLTVGLGRILAKLFPAKRKYPYLLQP